MDRGQAGHYPIMTDGSGSRSTEGGDGSPADDVSEEVAGPGPRVVRVAGDLDLHTGPALRGELLGRIESGQHDLVVDMEQVSYLDSSGITVLISGLKAARVLGGTVRLARCQPVILQLLDLTGLSRVFLVYPTVEEAQADPLARPAPG